VLLVQREITGAEPGGTCLTVYTSVRMTLSCPLCVIVRQVPRGVVGERVAQSAHRSVWNVVGGERHRRGLGGPQRLLDRRTVPVDRRHAGATCRRRAQDARLHERRTAVWHRRLAAPRVRLMSSAMCISALLYMPMVGRLNRSSLSSVEKQCSQPSICNNGHPLPLLPPKKGSSKTTVNCYH